MNISRGVLFASTLRLILSAGIFLLALRMFVTASDGYFFLLWNLCLAAVPYGCAFLFEKSVRSISGSIWKRGKEIVLFFLWIFFFPNAPYIVTDFTHLPWGHPIAISAPFLFDFSLVALFTGAGMLFGLGSLFRVQKTLRKLIGKIWADLISLCVILLSGVGVYLGRFLRWNSWDVFLNPLNVIRDTLSHYGDPAWFARAVFFSLLFSVFTAISYVVFVGLYRFFGRENEECLSAYGGRIKNNTISKKYFPFFLPRRSRKKIFRNLT